MMERTDVVKALECCRLDNEHQEEECDKCPFNECPQTICQNLLAYHTLALIRELTEENKRMSRTKYWAYPDGRIEMIPTVESVKADIVRKMQERLKATPLWFVSKDTIDQIAKELLEDQE
jgi:hypothetical protein